MGVKLVSASAGSVEIVSPATASNYTATMPAATGNVVLDSATQTLTNKTLGSGLVAGASLITSGTATASTSGTSIDFTSLPSWVKRVTVNLSGVSTNGTSVIQCQIGPVSGVETSSYLGTVTGSGGSGIGQVALSSGVSVYNSNAAANVWHGSFVFTLVNSSTNTWSFTSSTGASNSPLNGFTGGSKALAGALSIVRITTVNGTDTFDAGTINILYE